MPTTLASLAVAGADDRVPGALSHAVRILRRTLGDDSCEPSFIRTDRWRSVNVAHSTATSSAMTARRTRDSRSSSMRAPSPPFLVRDIPRSANKPVTLACRFEAEESSN